MNTMTEAEIQQKYYTETASQYDDQHLEDKDEHFFALSIMVGLFDYLGVKSVLDIGSGTGRALRYIQEHRPDIRIVGIEPVEALRKQGLNKGLAADVLRAGDATALEFADNEFDIVCEFGVLHHVKHPEKVVDEMLRVSKIGVFVSDVNNFGAGSFASRTLKQLINFFGLWKAFDLLKTKGKGYIITEGDGLSYSYSVFNNYKQIKNKCKSIHVMNTKDSDMNLCRTATHIALLGVK